MTPEPATSNEVPSAKVAVTAKDAVASPASPESVPTLAMANAAKAVLWLDTVTANDALLLPNVAVMVVTPAADGTSPRQPLLKQGADVNAATAELLDAKFARLYKS